MVECIGTLVQEVRVPAGIVEAVDVIDPQALEPAVADHLEDEAVRLREHLRIFDAHAGQIVDIEEAPVVDVVDGDAPEGQPVVLVPEQIVERVGRPGIGRIRGEARAGALDRGRDLRIAGALGELAFERVRAAP
jgi:hypothetical protein